jgi:hypothetical protein
MAGLVPAIHAFLCRKDVDARHEAGHDVDGFVVVAYCAWSNRPAAWASIV